MHCRHGHSPAPGAQETVTVSLISHFLSPQAPEGVLEWGSKFPQERHLDGQSLP